MTVLQRPRVIASVEARMGSSRLLGKVLMDLRGRPALGRLLDRLRQCKRLDGIVLATTTAAADDALEKFALSEGIPCYRGSEEDVLLRVVEAHRMMASEIIVEVTGDCPLLDPDVIDLGVDTFLKTPCDVVTNVLEPSWPMGVDVQVFRLSDLVRVERDIQDPPVREHVSLFFYENPDRYHIVNLEAPVGCRAPTYRFQLDYPEDKLFIEAVLDNLTPEFGDRFRTAEIIALLNRQPELLAININCEEKLPR
jgi:spore coat polysaccharide biosynthesis protein SpsF